MAHPSMLLCSTEPKDHVFSQLRMEAIMPKMVVLSQPQCCVSTAPVFLGQEDRPRLSLRQNICITRIKTHHLCSSSYIMSKKIHVWQMQHDRHTHCTVYIRCRTKPRSSFFSTPLLLTITILQLTRAVHISLYVLSQDTHINTCTRMHTHTYMDVKYIYMYVCAYVHVHTCIGALQKHMCTCMCAYMHTCKHTCVWLSTSMYACAHTNISHTEKLLYEQFQSFSHFHENLCIAVSVFILGFSFPHNTILGKDVMGRGLLFPSMDQPTRHTPKSDKREYLLGISCLSAN